MHDKLEGAEVTGFGRTRFYPSSAVYPKYIVIRRSFFFSHYLITLERMQNMKTISGPVPLEMMPGVCVIPANLMLLAYSRIHVTQIF